MVDRLWDNVDRERVMKALITFAGSIAGAELRAAGVQATETEALHFAVGALSGAATILAGGPPEGYALMKALMERVLNDGARPKARGH